MDLSKLSDDCAAIYTDGVGSSCMVSNNNIEFVIKSS
jgi:hypothetical protein